MTEAIITALAEALLNYHRGRAVYRSKKKIWYLANENNIWDEFEDVVLPVPSHIKDRFTDLTYDMIKKARKMCLPELTQENFQDNFNMNENLVAFTNGVLDLEAKRFRPIRVPDYIFSTICYGWKQRDDPHAENLINNYFDSLMGPDKTHLIWQFLVNVFSSKPTILVCTGASTANGKTLFKRFIGEAFDIYSTVLDIPDITKLPQRKFITQHLRGRRLVRLSYTDSTPFVVTNKFKKDYSIIIKSYAPVIVKENMVNEVMLFHFPNEFEYDTDFEEELLDEYTYQQLMRMLFRRYCLAH